jgi:defect in organelle trafficking protein DotA
MARYFWSFLFSFFPFLAFASETAFTSSAMSFTPTAGDYSMVYLGNIFGSVDGVLHGTGSQMMGTMLGVFNSAVLALGGVVIMYIIVVSTMNTAHEGEMLGHKWSSIWVPIRTVFGLALLVPKASGYCLMQIFVMWVVVQGVGVADKVWEAALNYLNRGGVIVQAQSSSKVMDEKGGSSISNGAATILYGQVCMLGLQMQLENARAQYLDQASSNSGNGTGPCAGNPSAAMQQFCDTPIPDLINSVDPLTAQIQADSGGTSPNGYSVPMPHLDPSSFYSFLNGICGTLKWNGVDTSTLVTTKTVIDPETKQCVIENGVCKTETSYTLNSMSSADLEMVKMTRGMGVQQMYTSLATVAQLMVNNDPQINLNKSGGSNNASVVAVNQFGVPLNGNTLCQSGSANCTSWGQDPDSSSSASVLLQGSELRGAVDDYNTMMAPTLRLLNEAKHASQANAARSFIREAEESGWIMAGSYFFNLVQLNGSSESSNEFDTQSGLDTSVFDTNTLTSVFTQSPCTGPYSNLCVYFNGDGTKINQIIYLIDGSAQTSVPRPNFSDANSTYPVFSGTQANSVYGYVDNALNLVLPGEPGTKGMNFNNLLPKPNLIPSNVQFNFTSNKCLLKVPVLNICLWNPGKLLIKPVLDFYFSFYQSMINIILSYLMMIIELMVYKPIVGFTYIFVKGVDILNTPGINPVVALAKMGISYINFAVTMLLGIAVLTSAASLIPGNFGPAVLSLLLILSPLFFGWIMAMLGIAFITAYYIPFLPYMLFMFGSIGWLITVIEAMVAAPIVALGVAHPEGHDALGKSEQGLMILLNVFLRPAMMVIGYIAGIALSYVGIWLMNAGFQNVFDYMKGSSGWGDAMMPWAYIFGFFFTSLLYTTTYLTIVQKSFTLIAVLPDKVLRWIGGQGEQTGQETMQWAEEGKSQVKEGIEPTTAGVGQITKQSAGALGKGIKKLIGKGGDGGGKVEM